MNRPEAITGSKQVAADGYRSPYGRSICFLTLGCKLNQCETGELRQRFFDHGFRPVEDISLAEIVYISTCGVTARAEQKSRQAIRHAAQINPNARIVVTGCAVQRFPEAFASLPGVSQVLGSQERMNPFPVLESGARQVVTDIDPERIYIAAGAPHGRTRAMIKIQDGCSVNCTYCVVPQARGPSRSVPPEEIISRTTELIDSGYQEIVLSGVHIGDYGKGLTGWNLCKLLDKLDNLTGTYRLRLSSLEPWTITPELIQRITTGKRVCPHIHIPFQSGSTAVLKGMRRPYDREGLEAVLDAIAQHPDIGLGGDVITGFPGESESDFQQTIELIESYPFSYLHVFPFSSRPGTPACDFPLQLNSAEITHRAKVLRALGQGKKIEFMSKLLGKTLRVIFEQKLRDGYRYGTAENYAKVRSEDINILPGTTCSMKITDVAALPITGVMIH